MDARRTLALPAHVGQRGFAQVPAMAEALAGEVAARLAEAIAQRGEASLVVAGGRSPLPYFHALAAHPLDWSRVTVTLIDERWVPVEHADSNAGTVLAGLLRGAAAAARFVPLYGGEASPEDGLEACAARLSELPRPFDVVVLGMGEDGHFASLFPGIPDLAALLDPDGPALAATHPPHAPHARMSLGVSALLDAHTLLLQVQGAKKVEVLESAAAADALEVPIAALLAQRRVPLQVFFVAQ